MTRRRILRVKDFVDGGTRLPVSHIRVMDYISDEACLHG